MCLLSGYLKRPPEVRLVLLLQIETIYYHRSYKEKKSIHNVQNAGKELKILSEIEKYKKWQTINDPDGMWTCCAVTTGAYKFDQ